MIFKQKLGQTDVTSLVERVSRFNIILKNPDRRTKPVMGNTREPVDAADPPEHYHNIPLTDTPDVGFVNRSRSLLILGQVVLVSRKFANAKLRASLLTV
jgi:hypothetical protein